MKQVLILAGGLGSRLNPYTLVIPKPLMPVGDQPVIKRVLNYLIKYDFKDIYISVGYLSELVENYVNGLNLKVKITYLKERKPLGTVGSIKLIKKINDSLLVINGDILSDMNLNKFCREHKKNKSLITVGLIKKKVDISLGVVKLAENKELIDFMEKPTYYFLASMGIDMVDKKVIKFIKKNERIDNPDLILRIKNKGHKIFGYVHQGFWLDIGRHEDLELANKLFEKETR